MNEIDANEKKMVGDDIFLKTYNDDDKLFSDSVSLKRRLTIIEKIIIIVCAIAIIPLTSLFTTYIHFGNYNQSFTNLDVFAPLGEDFIYTIAPYIVSIVFLIFFEFSLKNIGINRGILKSTVISLFLSLTIFSSSFGLIISFQFAIQKIGLNAELLANYLLLGVIASVFYTFLLFIGRLIEKLIDKYNFKYVMIIGPKEDADKLCKKMIKEKKKRIAIRFVFYEINNSISDRMESKVKKVNTIILLNSLTKETKEKMLLYFNSTLNKDIYLCSDFYDIVSYSKYTKDVSGILSIEQKPLKIDYVESFFKRSFDLFCATLLFILTIPVWLIVPIAIKIDSKGPVFFKQKRYTKGLRPFMIYKFRSMYADADANTLNTINDKRVTKIGKILRATRIDEIPQIINIFKGDMSFIGPRAWMTSDVEDGLKTIPEFKYRFNVKAGITGLQQVSLKAGASIEEKLRYDLYYIENYSFAMDLSILFLTVGAVFKKDLSEGRDVQEKSLYEYLLDQGILTNLHWDYRSLVYPKNVSKANAKYVEEAIKETIEITKISNNKEWNSFNDEKKKKGE